jgi:hypothetical protein
MIPAGLTDDISGYENLQVIFIGGPVTVSSSLPAKLFDADRATFRMNARTTG